MTGNNGKKIQVNQGKWNKENLISKFFHIHCMQYQISHIECLMAEKDWRSTQTEKKVNAVQEKRINFQMKHMWLSRKSWKVRGKKTTTQHKTKFNKQLQVASQQAEQSKPPQITFLALIYIPSILLPMLFSRFSGRINGFMMCRAAKKKKRKQMPFFSLWHF